MKEALLHQLQHWRAQKRPCAVVTHLSSGSSALVDAETQFGNLDLSPVQALAVRERVAADESGVVDDQLFVRVYAPPLRMIIVGAVHIASALARMAALAGFDIVIVDPREGFATSDQLAGIPVLIAWPKEGILELTPDMRTAVVTLTHDPKLDDPALLAALRSDAFYIGALGSSRTHAKRLERLKEAGATDAALARIHGPVGLDINASTPSEIAVSIIAQVIATLRAEAA